MAEASIKDLGTKWHLDLQATIGPVHGLTRRRQFSSGRCRSCCEGPGRERLGARRGRIAGGTYQQNVACLRPPLWQPLNVMIVGQVDSTF
jgi:hypothetical protein